MTRPSDSPTSTPSTGGVSPKDVATFSFRVWSYRMGEAVSLMIHVGDRLDLYRQMRGQGPLTSEELADKTGLDERLLREWLYGQAAADLLDHQDGRFELTDVQAMVLANEEASPAFSCGAFRGGIEPEVMDAVVDSFRTGRGITYEQQGGKASAGLARMTGQSNRLSLVPNALPRLDGVVAKLEAGATVVDVGCGGGVALIEVAKAFPDARCIGYDPSATAIEQARTRADEAGVGRIEFVAGGAADLPSDLGADLVMTLDVLHDIPRPDQAASAIRSALADDGTWLVKEIRSSGDFDTDRKNPLLAMFYGFSLFSCLQSAVSEPDGLGLGTLGLHPEALKDLVTTAGFSRFDVHDCDEPGNLYYEVRL